MRFEASDSPHPFDHRASRLRLVGSLFTGLEPVSMLLHPQDSNLLFVSNHVSDTVSVIDLSHLEVIQTLVVGDEPQGMAIAGGRLFVACARASEQPLEPGGVDPTPVHHHQVSVFQATAPYDFLGNVAIQAVKPRDLVARDGVIYVVPQNSGNKTIIMDEDAAADEGLTQLTPDAFNPVIEVNPIIAKPIFNTGAFGRGWKIPFAGRIVFDWEYPNQVATIPDHDVTAIEASTLTVLPTPTTGVGTTLFDAEWNPWTGDLWITNTDANNRIRFEPELQGRALSNRITIVEPQVGVRTIFSLDAPATPQSYAQPSSLVFGQAGGPRAFVASLGTAKVVMLDGVDGTWLGSIETPAVPSALAFDDMRRILYVYTRSDHRIHAFEVGSDIRPLETVALGYDPEPPIVRRGREHLYSASASTGHGNDSMSCASCHVFGHTDAMGWDLGDSGGSLSYHYPDIMTDVNGFEGFVVSDYFTPIPNPMKGPMTTQSFRGLLDPLGKDDIPLHWRGDRRLFHQFGGAFVGLLGGSGLDPRKLQEFTTFVRSLTYAPNPYQHKDRVYRGSEDLGRDTYGMNDSMFGKEYIKDTGLSCIVCHKGNFFDGSNYTGSRPTVSHGAFSQIFNTAQLRNNYERDFRDLVGFGALHDGAVDGVRGFMDFLKPRIGDPVFPEFTEDDKDQVAAFVKSWDHGLGPMVGAQWTVDADNQSEGWAFLGLAEAQAQAEVPHIDLILKGLRFDGSETHRRGALYEWNAQHQDWGFMFDTGDWVSTAVVMSIARSGHARWTFTAVPPGLGIRLGIDRDEDGLFDSQERAWGTHPRRPDTDRDGFTDGAEVAGGSDPLDAAETPTDSEAPELRHEFVAEVSAQTATWTGVFEEPVRLLVEVGSGPGLADIGAQTRDGLRCRHDVLWVGLPAASEVFYTVTATDAAGNTTSVAESFETFARLLHVEDITLELEGAGPYTAMARVLVHDERGSPVVGAPIRAFWDGEIGAQSWVQESVTGSDGWAEFPLEPFSPPSGSHLAFSPGFLGSVDPTSEWFVGLGGQDVPIFYDQPANSAHYRTVIIP